MEKKNENIMAEKPKKPLLLHRCDDAYERLLISAQSMYIDCAQSKLAETNK